jgi:hypothetical protein
MTLSSDVGTFMNTGFNVPAYVSYISGNTSTAANNYVPQGGVFIPLTTGNTANNYTPQTGVYNPVSTGTTANNYVPQSGGYTLNNNQNYDSGYNSFPYTTTDVTTNLAPNTALYQPMSLSTDVNTIMQPGFDVNAFMKALNNTGSSQGGFYVTNNPTTNLGPNPVLSAQEYSSQAARDLLTPGFDVNGLVTKINQGTATAQYYVA